ncbi:hypothetical protein ABZR86_01565 [Dyella marensis]|uniref:Uncharacterized protein n=1 Tax=Dyella marensis TaxID=500610 RepID=A0A1I2AK44_9GAMM|nr:MULTISPECIES: hypothetical protein [Dyella]SFE44087.1 hypothetical protein SAMN02799615_01053 [Dyella marensis]
MSIELDQADIDTLRNIHTGRLKIVETRRAARLMLMGYLAPLEAGCAALAPAKTERNGKQVPLRITYGGTRLLARFRGDGEHDGEHGGEDGPAPRPVRAAG